MTPEDMHYMRLELLKTAGPYDVLLRAGRVLTRSPGASAAAGAVAGGALGAARGAMQGRQEGNALGGAITGGTRGALAGGVLAGGVGGAGRLYRDAKLLNPSLTRGQALGAAARSAAEKVKNFGKRQLHGFTGAYADKPGEIGLRSAATAEKKIHLEKLRLGDELAHTPTEAKRTALKTRFADREKDLLHEGAAGQELLEAGGTSLPGIVKGLRKDPRRLGKALWQENTGGGALGATLGVGLPGAFVARDLARGDESASGGRTLKQKIVQGGAVLGGGFLTGGMPIIPMMASAGALEGAAGRLTKPKEKQR